MSHYSILFVTPTKEEWIPNYLSQTGEVLTRHGGKFLARTSNHEQVEGEEESAVLRIIIEWPSKDAAIAFMNDPDYVPHLQARTEGSVSKHFLIEGKDALA